ncbi:MAG TPA: acetyl-CoA hydrolase/transferase C-terminal domain-containing protein [Steroidobacter sp.]|uniref:acetyl-CoA hydrolase/transferase C-terminal domain-containing protein n=1 Tax=Steroidobacter sp. TaxID=1978227 RepID=UPI002EDAB002
MSAAASLRFTTPEDCVEATLSRVGKHVVMGLPVAIGKPNTLVNAFVARALADRSLKLTIITALSLRAPKGSSDLQRRFIEPFSRRVFGNYPELDYLRLIERRELPANIEVLEFYLEPGAWLHNEHLQQHYLSSNYTHVARDALRRGLNVIAQQVAAPPPAEAPGLLSLGSNADMTADLLPQIAAMRAGGNGQPFTLIGQVHSDMPFMYGDALVTADTFDFLVKDPGTALFSPPNMPVAITEHAIALNVSTLIRDGGTLQLGIGELGDGICYALQLRQQQPALYREIIESTGLLARHRRLIESEGGTAPFERGLYGCTEMLADGFLDLYRNGILKRRVYPSAKLQRLLDDGHIDERVSLRTLEALVEAGMSRMSYADFQEFREVGLFRDDVEYDRGVLITPDGQQLHATFSDPEQRAQIAQHCLGDTLRNGVLADAGFFFGPKDFYAALRNLPAVQRKMFAMRGISFINELYGHEWELKFAQRRYARFVNTTMMVTGLGAAVSDALTDGRVVSGVGGQYNFVAMAHALPEARSILCLRATRNAGGRTTSNVVWSYGHATVPRHLRDIVVTEYGIADLRGRTDREIVEALIGIMDARFQSTLVADAKRAGKLPKNWHIPEAARANTPEQLAKQLAPWRERGLFDELPFGTDFTAEEVVLAKALRSLQTATATWPGRIRTMLDALLNGTPEPSLQPHLARMGLENATGLSQTMQRRLLTTALRKILHGG